MPIVPTVIENSAQKGLNTMPTQRKRAPTRRGASPMRGDGGGGDYRGGNRKNGNLTGILTIMLVFAVIALFVLIYLFQSKNNKPVQQAPVVEQKAPPPAPPAPVKAPEPIVEEAPKKKPKEVPAPKKNINLEVTGEKPVEPAPAEVAPVVKKKVNSDDDPVPPKSFMGGLSNPEMEKNQGSNPDQDRAREERRKKKDYELE